MRSPGTGAGIGLPVVSGSNNSVLFVNPAGTLAEDNANFTYTLGTTTLAAPTITAATKFLAPDGLVGTPSLAFANETNTGFYRVGASNIGFTLGGTRLLVLGSGVLGIDGVTSAFTLYTSGFGAIGSQISLDAANATALKNGNSAQEYRVYAGNGGFMSNVKTVNESLTIAAAATTVGATSIPASAILLAVAVRVTTVIPTAATFTVTTTVGGTTLNTAAVSTAANSTDAGTAAGASYRAAATTVTITPNLVPGAATGVVRLTYYYIQVTPPTS